MIFIGIPYAGCRFHALGNLRNGGNAGLFYVNGNNRLGNERWNIGSRQSGCIRYYLFCFTRVWSPLPAGEGFALSTDKNLPCDAGLVTFEGKSSGEHSIGNQREKNIMKTYCKGLVVDVSIVWKAYCTWLEAPAGRKNKWRVRDEYGSDSALVREIVYEIKHRTLTLRPIHRYTSKERSNGKVRLIGVESIKQQIVDYIIVLCLNPMLSAKVGYYQVAGVRGKGSLFASQKVFKWLNDGTCRYHVKSDITKCYLSTDIEMVYDKLSKYVGSKDIMYLIRVVFDTYRASENDVGQQMCDDDCSCDNSGDVKTGLEIGSYFSMRIMAFILSFAYHYVESLHKTRRDKKISLVSHQLWQMDDIVLFSRSKKDLKMAMRKLERYLRNELGLRIKPWKICEVSEEEPVDICGYKIRPSHIELREGTFLRGRRAIIAFNKRKTLYNAYRVVSYYGLFVHSDCKDFIKKTRMNHVAYEARRVISKESRSK